jgi:DNA replication protein DnaC
MNHENKEPQHIGEFIAPLVAGFERIQRQYEAFKAEIRPIFDAAEAPFFCKEHPDTPLTKNWEETVTLSWRDRRFNLSVNNCPQCIREEEKRKEAKKWTRLGVPFKLVDADFPNYEVTTEDQNRALESAMRFSRRNHGFLLLAGTTGTGKSHLACACLKNFGNGIYITNTNLLNEMRSHYGQAGDIRAFYEKYRRTPFLVIDEIGMSAGGADEQPMFYEILAYRHDADLPTVLVSNYPMDKLADFLGDRLADRIRQDCVKVVATWPSYRTSK